MQRKRTEGNLWGETREGGGRLRFSVAAVLQSPRTFRSRNVWSRGLGTDLTGDQIRDPILSPPCTGQVTV